MFDSNIFDTYDISAVKWHRLQKSQELDDSHTEESNEFILSLGRLCGVFIQVK